jgi:hypothetical protein
VTAEVAASPAEPESGRDWVEIIATVVLSLAAVATAWSSYQATRWNGEQAKAASRTNGVRIEAARAQGLAEEQTQVDVALFIQWVDASAVEAEVLSTVVRRNIQRAANYVLGVVLFSVSLFFAGMSTKLHGTGSRRWLLTVGCLVFLGTAAWMATFPISISISS